MNIFLLDGGLGQEIFRRSNESAHPLWSAQVMKKHPEIVKSVHRDFMNAGAQCLTVNAYTLTPSRLQRDGDISWFEPLQELALEIANEQRKEHPHVKIAGCLPPLVGSYTPDNRPLKSLRKEYDAIVSIQAPAVDFFIAETISSIRESKAAISAAKESDKKVIVSFTLKDDLSNTLRSGESILVAMESAVDFGADAFMFNCSIPEAIDHGLKLLKNRCSVPYGGYANGFTVSSKLIPGGTVDSLDKRHDITPAKYFEHVLQWIDDGASIVGGCCEVGPSHINYVYTHLKNMNLSVIAEPPF